jgi:glycosyltransferase involved in cell wall biosynthesis
VTAPLVSIVIPAYNSGEWIAETLESAVGQTWANKEIIVVDDGSTDDTLRIAKGFSARNVQVVTQPNQGAAAARNTALALCQGDYIQYLDADDILEPDKIETQIGHIRSHGLSPRTLVSGAWATFHYRRNRAQFVPSPLWANLSPVEWLLRKLSQHLYMQTDNWLVSRQLTDAVGPWDEQLFRDNDGEYFARVMVASEGVHFVPDAKSYWRVAGFKSVSYVGGSSKKLESLCRSIKLHIKYLRSLEDSERVRAACLFYIGSWLHEFYPYRPDLAEELKRATEQLGGRFEEPRLSRKYQWIVDRFGWRAARRAQILLPKVRWSVAIEWDRLMFNLNVR